MFPFPCPLEPLETARLRAEVRRRLLCAWPALAHSPICRLDPAALDAMLRHYDALFFDGLFARRLPQLCVVGTARMTRCAGKFCARIAADGATDVQIRMSTDFLFRLRKGPFFVNGVEALDALEAFQLVFEHELCHAAEWALYGTCSAHQSTFRALSHGLFQHRTCTHALPTRAQEAAAQGVGVGARVSFPFEARTLCGVVSRVGKTASVMVPSAAGAWHDKRGRRYDKYTVPLSLLTPRRRG